ncbi:MAG: sulfatase-like hydrolase/transferase [Planctomycetes bacterium]|nr:sulfatase-like hydrolase/transferase [Planctomycetota bacterium]
MLISMGCWSIVCADTVRPNIVWLVSEDHGPHMGCYGDRFATTPNMDRLASRGLRYRHCWSNAPVCAPARTTLISGLYATSLGAEHMRSFVPFPRGLKMAPQWLRDAGYYCTNNAKEDYNVAQPGQVWDASSRQAHWSHRQPGQPFFAVFNSEKSHESQIRVRPHQPLHDPARVRVPAYHPDTPEVRQDWAQYYDCVTQADADAGRRLQELEDAGLLDQTIVFYFADHGSGMPRNKRSACNSGLQVPLIVYIPERFEALRPPEYATGGSSERLVSFVDFAPTLLSLAGIKPPESLPGQAFLGKHSLAPAPLAFGFRGRMDERYDLVRSATDGRYVYLRNYLPHLPAGQHLDYMFQTPTTRVWKKLHDAGQLSAAQAQFWSEKPSEELYDLEQDPDEVQNLAESADHQPILERLRRGVQQWMATIRDVGFVPEGERLARASGDAVYDFGHDARRYPFERIWKAAELASWRKPASLPELIRLMKDDDSAVRYWAVMGIAMQKGPGVAGARAELQGALQDRSPYVRIVAAQALATFGSDQERTECLELLLGLSDCSRQNVFVSIAALTSLDELGEIARAVAVPIAALPRQPKLPHERYSPYVPRLLDDLNARFASPP